MPNWYYTSYVIEGDAAVLQDLYDKMMPIGNLTETNSLCDFGKLGLKNIVELFGGNPEKLNVRGELVDYPQLDEVLRFQTMTAWYALNDVWDLVSRHYRSLRYYYSAEEPGCTLYYSNDSNAKYFKHYVVDEFRDGEEYYDTPEEVLSDVSERLGITLTSWNMMEAELGRFNDTSEDNAINVHEFEIVNYEHKTPEECVN